MPKEPNGIAESRPPRPGSPLRRWLRLRWTGAKRVFLQIARGAATPHAIALGVAIGFVAGWTPTIGFQMMLAAPVCILLRANFLAAVPPIWLTNPATIVPIYGFNYWVGLKLVGGPGVDEFCLRIEEVKALLLDSATSWSQTGSALWSLTVDFMLPLWTGCIVVGFALAIPAYFIVFALVTRFRANLEARRARRRAGTLPPVGPS